MALSRLVNLLTASAGEGRERVCAVAVSEMLRITRPGGTLIVTVPYGRFEDHGWFVNYDAANIERLFRNVRRRDEEYFRFTPTGWLQCRAEEVAEIGYGEGGAPAAAGLACFEIEKPPGSVS